jgi:hypothetical protein
MIIDKNNLGNFDTFNLYKWIFKTFVAVFILTNTFNIVMGIFELSQTVINASAGVIGDTLALGNPDMMAAIEAELQTMGIGELMGLFLEIQIVYLCMGALAIVIFVIVWGRMIEIYIVVSIAPIPLSTMVNREWGSMGNNYIKSLLAVAFQGFLIMVCIAVYAALVAAIADAPNIHAAVWTILGYTVLLCFILLKTGNLAKSIFQAH